MSSQRPSLAAVAAGFMLFTAIMITGCQQENSTGPSVTDIQFKRGGGGGGKGPKVDSTDPPSAPPDITLDVRVLGSGFADGSVVTFTIDGVAQAEFRTITTTFVSKSELVANVTLDADAQVNLYDVEVVTLLGKKGVGADLFSVILNEPADPAIAFVVQGTVEDLRVMNASGLHEAVVLQAHTVEFPGHVGRPAWSPDGGQIVFGNSLITIKVGGNGEPEGGPPVTIIEPSPGGGPAWSPLGDEIAYAERHEAPGELSSLVLVVIPPDGTGPEILYNAPPGRLVYYSTWSPDGARLAVVERLDTANGNDFEPVIRVISRSAGAIELTLLAGRFENIHEVDWQRGHLTTEIAFAARSAGKRPKDRGYFVYTLDTSDPATTLTQLAEGRSPSWSPDDLELLFQANNSGPSNMGKLSIMNLDTGAVRTVSSSNGIFGDWRR